MTSLVYLLGAGAIAVTTVAAAARLPRAYATAAALAGALAVVLTKEALYPHGLFDDAFITFRYARNLSDGAGPVWNPGQHVEGYTGFLWMALLAGMHRIGFDVVLAATALAYASLVATILLAWRIWLLWSDDAGGAIARPAALAVALLCIGLSDPITTWGTSGLETPLAAALLTATVYLYLRESRAGGPPWSAVAAAAAAMTRPELLVVAAVTGAFSLVSAGALRDRRRLWLAVAWLGLFAGLYGTYFAWRYSYYGYVFPNTYYVKVGTSTVFLHRGFEYVRTSIQSQWFLPFVAGAVLLLFSPAAGIRRDARYVLAVTGAWLLAVVIEGGDAYPHGRFLAPLVPVLFLTGVAGAATLLDRLLPRARQFAIAGGAAALLIGLALITSSFDSHLADERRTNSEVRALGEWLRQSAPPDFTVATVAAGAIPYYSRLPSLDLLGLNDETIAHTKVPNFGKGLAAHEKYNTEYVLTVVRPEVIVIGPYPVVLPKQTLVESKGQVAAMDSLLSDPRTFQLYEAVGHFNAGVWFNLLQRKDTLGQLSVDWTESGGYRNGRGPAR
jgi:hypothetical protein